MELEIRNNVCHIGMGMEIESRNTCDLLHWNIDVLTGARLIGIKNFLKLEVTWQACKLMTRTFSWSNLVVHSGQCLLSFL